MSVCLSPFLSFSPSLSYIVMSIQTELGRVKVPQEPFAGTWATDQRCVVQPLAKPWQLFAKKPSGAWIVEHSENRVLWGGWNMGGGWCWGLGSGGWRWKG